MKQALEFIIIGTTKVGEKSLVLHTLSAQYGRRSFIVSISKSSSMALYLPLNILSGEVNDNHLSDLWRVSALRAEYPLAGLRGDVRKNTMTMFLSEVLFRCLRDGEYSYELYDWCRQSILTLDALGEDFANFHLLWLLDLCGVLGFSPRIEDLMPFAEERLEDIRALLTLDRSSALLLPLSGARRSDIASILLEYLGYHLDTRLNIRSLSVLRELYM
ncbi:MAG: DNA repair protein RecO C-terminal domain-containing protein [Bacteroidales bacterium]|nr:DNA repair protein RecO C-terminal domain-containing protein [Bacteroidales bacterium]